MKCNSTPGCAGDIDQYGFCGECGSAPKTAAAPSPAPAPAPSAGAAPAGAASDSSQCKCGGKFVGGFCDECGDAYVVAPVVPPKATGQSQRTHASRLSGKTSNRSQRSSSKLTSTRRQLGLGLVDVQEIPAADPLKSLMAEAKLPENKRICTGIKNGNQCNEKLTFREKGVCIECRTPYNFEAGLVKDEIVADQYKVAGCIAFGGMGWIYLAHDETLNRYVVLKGLVNQNDKSLADAAVAERQFLAEVKHRNIVSVYTCVRHTNERGSAAYTVMEYVGGKTLKSLYKERGKLPIAEVLAYGHAVLEAFRYLHSLGLIYNDFKPDNVMLEGGDIKVIDLGGVTRVDVDSDIYSTTGYAAPELATRGPSVASDLYTIGRAIAVLATDFHGFNGDFVNQLRPREEVPEFQKYESFHRFLLKATHADHSMRFQSAEEMSAQLAGVLREVVCIDEGKQHPSTSTLFGQDTLGLRDLEKVGVNHVDAESLPVLNKELSDPAAAALANIGSGDPARQTALFEGLVAQYPESLEALLAAARNQIQLNNQGQATSYLHMVEQKDGFDWRVAWYRGLLKLTAKDASEAMAFFQTCYDEVPGELAPKLAIAVAAELGQDIEQARAMYETVVGNDHNYATAVFGLARCLALQGKRAEAVAALARVPQTSNLYPLARKQTVQVLMADMAGNTPTEADLVQAASTQESMGLTGQEKLVAARKHFERALDLLSAGKVAANQNAQILGVQLGEASLQLALEGCLRDLARLTRDAVEKQQLVELANQVRPITVF